LKLAAYSDAPMVGGAELSLGHLLACLSADFEVTVVGVDRRVVEALAARRPGAGVAIVPSVRHKGDLPAIRSHVAAVRHVRPDILHANLRTPWTCAYGLLAGFATPGVRTVAVEQLPMPSGHALQRLLKRLASRRLDAHVAVGEEAARIMERYVGLPRGSVLTIHNGVPDVPLPPRPDRRAAPVVGSLGRLDSQKGYDVLLHAMARIPDVEVVLVGDGPERPALERLAGELELGGRLSITGWTPDPRSLLPSFDVFVLPSRYEGFPLSIVEAMLAWLPVVATPAGSVAEAVSHGETGLLVRPDDPAGLAHAIRRLVTDPGERRRMGERGRTFALERYTAERMAASFEALYRRLVDQTL
jgi:glycosyltransferase involved in cell wall biosynthesis